MTYNCNITQKKGKYLVQFPDVPNAITLGFTHEEALFMAGDVLNGILASHLDNGYPISEPKYSGGYPIEVSLLASGDYNHYESGENRQN